MIHLNPTVMVESVAVLWDGDFRAAGVTVGFPLYQSSPLNCFWNQPPRDCLQGLCSSFLQPLSVHGWTLASLLHRSSGAIAGKLSHFLPRWLRTGWQSVRKKSLKHSAMAGNWTRATERTDSEIYSFSYWAIMTRATGRTDSEMHSFSHRAIMTRATGRTDSEIHSFSHWAIMNALCSYSLNKIMFRTRPAYPEIPSCCARALKVGFVLFSSDCMKGLNLKLHLSPCLMNFKRGYQNTSFTR